MLMVSHQNLFLGLLPSPTPSAPGRASISSLTPAAHHTHACPDAYSISLPWRTQRAAQPCATNKNLFYNEHSFFFFFLTMYLVALCLSCSMWALAPWPGIKPRPPALGARSVSHWTTREVPVPLFLKPKIQLIYIINFKISVEFAFIPIYVLCLK